MTEARPDSPTLERPFSDGLLVIRVSRNAPTFPFADFAQYVATATGGRIVRRLGSPFVDQAYWDIAVGALGLILHYEHMAGIYLCAGDVASEALVGELLSSVQQNVAQHPPAVQRETS